MNYTTSRDYEELFQLIESGERIPCFYDEGLIRQIGYARESFGVYCIGHDADCYDKEMFINRAKKIHAEFLIIDGWIKIESDKDLPPVGDYDSCVLVYRKDGVMDIRRVKYLHVKDYLKMPWYKDDGITHWMPLPEAPKE